MKTDAEVYLKDILECIVAIERYTKNDSAEQFEENMERQDAVMRRLEIIGEAVKNLPTDFKEAHPHIPWKQVAGMRDVLIHTYANVSLDRVWKVIKDDLPVLKEVVSNNL